MPALSQLGLSSVDFKLEQDKSDMLKAITTIEESSSDPFDGSAEPIVYLSENRMPVFVEFSTTVIYIVFAALMFSLILILPGVRRTKFISLLSIFTLLAMGASILLGLYGSQWLVGELTIQDSPYSSLNSETITGKLELNVGLSWVNVTLVGKLVGFAQDGPESLEQTTTSINYNERFHWDQPDRMAVEHLDALKRGLPYPILTVTEFLSQDYDGFNWTGKIRVAGQYCALVLYASLASWFLTLAVMCAIPHYLPHMMQITGAFMMLSVTIFTLLTETPKNLDLFLGQSQLELTFGLTYMSTFVAGALALLVGLFIMVLQLNNPHDALTMLDSESYLEDQKALYKINILETRNCLGKHEKFQMNLSGLKKSETVIPIDDIKIETEKTAER